MKRILLSNGHQTLNQQIGHHLLSQGHSLALLFPTPEALTEGQARWNEAGSGRVTCFLSSVQLEECVGALGGLDAVIHGHEQLDEARLLAENPLRFQECIGGGLQQCFSLTRAAIPYLLRNEGGSIVFPLIYDSLHYAGYPTSPVMDHGKLSMMKSLSRELTTFGIQVNELTLGYHDPGFSPAEKKARRQRLSIYGLKPPLVPIEQLLTAFDFLLGAPCAHIGGQNIHVGFGIETTV